MLFGWHESATYENRLKTTTPKLMRLCKPNSKFMKLSKFYKIIKSENMLFGWHQVVETRAQQQESTLAPTWFIETG